MPTKENQKIGSELLLNCLCNFTLPLFGSLYSACEQRNSELREQDQSIKYKTHRNSFIGMGVFTIGSGVALGYEFQSMDLSGMNIKDYNSQLIFLCFLLFLLGCLLVRGLVAKATLHWEAYKVDSETAANKIKKEANGWNMFKYGLLGGSVKSAEELGRRLIENLQPVYSETHAEEDQESSCRDYSEFPDARLN